MKGELRVSRTLRKTSKLDHNRMPSLAAEKTRDPIGSGRNKGVVGERHHVGSRKNNVNSVVSCRVGQPLYQIIGKI